MYNAASLQPGAVPQFCVSLPSSSPRTKCMRSLHSTARAPERRARQASRCGNAGGGGSRQRHEDDDPLEGGSLMRTSIGLALVLAALALPRPHAEKKVL